MSAPVPPGPADDVVLEADAVDLGYGRTTVVRDLSLQVRRGSFTVLLGPNASGKSTALKGLARLLPPRAGVVRLEGRDLAGYRPREVATRMAVLPQSPVAPPDVVVEDLVLRGRAPHQAFLRRFGAQDERAVAAAMELTGVAELAQRPVDELSGGQRQRVWIAVALAQETPVLLLDEPTTFLDLAHQIEVLDLCARLHAEGRTLVLVLHDLGLAARYASELAVFSAGRLVTYGPPGDVLTADLVRDVFDVECEVVPDPQTGTPLVVPAPPPHLRVLGRTP